MDSSTKTRVYSIYDPSSDDSAQGSQDQTRTDGTSLNFGDATAINRVTLARDYELLKQLGRGGMGIVYLAYQPNLKRKVAYKVLTELAFLDSEALLRFQAEAEFLARLQHPHIVQVFDFGTWENTPYLAMEYLPGGSLAEQLRRRRYSPRDTAAMIAPVARAVGHAHAHSVIHRDLNPGNILLTSDGVPKVTDFGLARNLTGVRVTRTGLVAGTPQYMAPEQMTGNRVFTPAVDIWAIGVILYEMLSGTVPFAGQDPQEIFNHVLCHEVVSLREWQPNLARDLETICLKCLHKEPERRYANGNELAEDLERFLDHRTILARPVGKVEKSLRWCRRNPLVAGLTLGIAIILVAGSAVSLALADWAFREQARTIEAAQSEADLRKQAEAAVEAQKTALADQVKAHDEAEVLAAVLQALLGSVQPGKDTLGGLRRQLDDTAAQLKHGNHDPLLRAKLFYTLAMTRRNLGDYEQAIELLEEAYALRKEHLGEEHAVFRKTAHELCYTYTHVGRGEDAIRVFAATFERELKIVRPDTDDMILLLAEMQRAYCSANRHDEAKELGERIIDISKKLYGDDDVKTHWARANQDSWYRVNKKYDQFIPILETALGRFQAELDPNSVEIIWTVGVLGICFMEVEKPEKAVPYLERFNKYNVDVHGLGHPITLKGQETLADAYERTGRHVDAVPLRRLLKDYFESTGNEVEAERQEKLIMEDMETLKK